MHFPSIQEPSPICVSSQERARNAGAERYLVGSSHDKAISLKDMNHARALVNSRKSECDPRTLHDAPDSHCCCMNPPAQGST